jgi:uncharacterized protein (TIGR03083 family)
MSAVTVTPVESIPAIGRAEAAALAATEHARYVDQLRPLGPGDWSKPTDCPLWDVRATAGHSIAMMADCTSYRAFLRRMSAAARAARRSGADMVDEMTAMQVASVAHLTTGELIAAGDDVGPRAARWRTGTNRLFRRLPIKQEAEGRTETWRMSYLLDVILTRDPWMHRLDIARATGCEHVLTADHDGRLVADVVAEWARRHRQPFRLTLTGPAGGVFAAGGDRSATAPELVLDATEFCRILSGRTPGEGMLATPVPF